MRLDRDIIKEIDIKKIASGELTDSPEAILKARMTISDKYIYIFINTVFIVLELIPISLLLWIKPTDHRLDVGILGIITFGVLWCLCWFIVASSKLWAAERAKCLYLLHRLKKYEELK